MHGASDNQHADVAVIGGGLAGLTAAAVAARRGRKVVLFEQARELGGRARTLERDGYFWNIGPHALYRSLAGERVLAELGVVYHGSQPPVQGEIVADSGTYVLPAGLLSLLATRYFDARDKLQFMLLLGQLPRIDAAAFEHTSVSQWIEARKLRPRVGRLVLALARLATYSHAPHLLSAGAFLRQFQSAVRYGVLYLDRGWQTLVDGLRDVAVGAGVRIASAAKVESIVGSGSGLRLELAGGKQQTATAVICATAPGEAARVVQPLAEEHRQLADAAAQAVPVYAATLDLALRELPSLGRTFAIGVDEPWYFSVHSATAQLAPGAGAVIHAARYLAPGESPAAADIEARLEQLVDRIQPGWRELIVARRVLPQILVANDLPKAVAGGCAGRQNVRVTGSGRVFVAGDWVGDEGQLADAALASGQRAGELAASVQAVSADMAINA